MNNLANSEWLQIRRGATAIIFASQRASGLWYLASGPSTDAHKGVHVGSAEHKIREEGAFGYETISGTWAALSALTEILGRPPERQLERAANALELHRVRNGAYGTWKGGWHFGRRVNESSRHSAMALLCLLEFSDWLDPKPDFQHCLVTVNWLLQTTCANGGWDYENPGALSDAEPLSTAASVAALCVFWNHFSAQLASEADLSKRIEEAIQRAFSRLGTLRSGRLWEVRSPASQVVDSAFILDALCLAYKTHKLSHAVADSAVQIRNWTREFMECQLSVGWPENKSSQRVSISASICALHVLLIASDMQLAGAIPQSLFSAFEGHIREAIVHRAIWRDLTAWDWIHLARLSNVVVTHEPDIALEGIDDAVHLVTVRGGRNELTKVDLKTFPYFSRNILLYMLSYGRPDSIPSGTLKRWYLRMPQPLQLMIDSVPGAVTGYILGIATGYILKWFS